MKKYLTLFSLVLATACIMPQLVSDVSTLAAAQDEPAPVLSVSVSPSSLMPGALATVYVRVENSGSTDWDSYHLLLGYGLEGDSSQVAISYQSFSLPAGQVFEDDIPWIVDSQTPISPDYLVQLAITAPDNVVLGEVSVPVAIVQPTLTINLDPPQPGMGSWVVITVQVINPSGQDIEGYSLAVGHGADAQSFYNELLRVPLSLKAGETFSQEVRWLVNYSLSLGDYHIVALLFKPDGFPLTTLEAPLTLPTP